MQVDWAKDGGQKNVGTENFFVRGWDRTADERSFDADREAQRNLLAPFSPAGEKGWG